jgi:hypothetical protein
VSTALEQDAPRVETISAVCAAISAGAGAPPMIAAAGSGASRVRASDSRDATRTNFSMRGVVAAQETRVNRWQIRHGRAAPKARVPAIHVFALDSKRGCPGQARA